MLHVTFLILLRALEVNIDLRHVNHIRYYYCLSQYCTPVASLPGRSHLRSGDLFVPATSTKTIEPRGFFHAGPTAWNCLPPCIV